MPSSTSNTLALMPCTTMRGHTKPVQGVVHLPGKRRIITCSYDSSLRLWDLESGTQIGEGWRDENDRERVKTIALSPHGDIVTTGSDDGTVRLWDVDTRKVVAKWAGHTENVLSVCWSVGGKRVLTGSSDGTARIWNVINGETVLAIETGHVHVWAAIYSPDQTKFATGGFKKNGIRVWDAKTGELLVALKHNRIVFSLTWTSDGKKLISTSYGPITIFDTATWQETAILEGHTSAVGATSLSCNNRLLVSASDDNTARLWNLDTNLPVGPPLHHEHEVTCAAFSADAKVVVTGCEDKNAYAWDVHAILKEAGLEDLLPDIPAQKSLKDSYATRHPPISSQDRRVPQGFFDGVQRSTQSYETRRTHILSPGPHSRSNRPPLLARFLSFLRHPYTTEPQQPPRFTPIPLTRPTNIKVAGRNSEWSTSRPPIDTQQQSISHGQGSSTTPPVPSTNTFARPARSQFHRLWARLVLFLCCVSPQHTDDPQPTQQQEGQSQGQVSAQGSLPQTQPAVPSTSATPSSSRPDGLVSRLFSRFRSQPHTDEDIPHAVEVAAMMDKGALFVAEQPQSHPRSASTAQPGAGQTHSLPYRLFAHLALYLCCVCNHQRPDSDSRSTQQQKGQSQDPVQTHATSSQTQQQGQSQGQDQAQASSSQTQPTPSTSTTPTSNSRPDQLIRRMSSLFHPQSHTIEEIELTEFPSRPHIVEVAVAQDGEACLAPVGDIVAPGYL